MPKLSRRSTILAACSAVVAALLAVAALAPLPVVIAEPGLTADVLGSNAGTPVITVSGSPVRATSGQLRMVTIQATGPSASVHFTDVAKAWFADDQAAMPREAVYPSGNTTEEIDKVNQKEMTQSQQDATAAALNHLHLSPSTVKVELRLADVGGPSAGLLFSLGIIDKIAGNGRGGDLTAGRVIAGTGTIDAQGKVGAVGGVPLKELAARRDGATVFLVPRAECSDAKARLPKGLQLIPVETLNGTLSALDALAAGKKTPTC
ncbi:S16 family serine protease [Streptomyces sp. NPDC021224]|uniref:S16 family serine protease n=1 Tax=unclassified Streptomyces TaxID=2593676 RepID=UPI003796544A